MTTGGIVCVTGASCPKLRAQEDESNLNKQRGADFQVEGIALEESWV